MTSARHLIVNADDFGQSAGINRGIAEAHERGVVTSASLMVRWPGAAEAAAYARSRPALGLGLHFDLGEWQFLDGRWTARYEVVPTDRPDAVSAELLGQLRRFRELVGGEPTHLDSHQHVHMSEGMKATVSALAAELGLPLRGVTKDVIWRGDFYGETHEGSPLPEAITVDSLLDVLEGLPLGTTELTCHPGYTDGDWTTYRASRAVEVRSLCDRRVKECIQRMGIILCSFADAPLGLARDSAGGSVP